MPRSSSMAATLIVALMTTFVLATATPAEAADKNTKTGRYAPIPGVLVPIINPSEGRRLFISKGCVVCHSVNGVGGMGGPPLDSPTTGEPVDIADFAARMWRGARAMSEWQIRELGYQIELTGQEIGHLAAFMADRRTQARLTLRDLPEVIRDWMVEEPLEPVPMDGEITW